MALSVETNDVFEITPLTKDTDLEHEVGADVVYVAPRKASKIHRHRHAETVLFILGGKGIIRVGDEDIAVEEGDRVIIHKGAYHGVRTGDSWLRFVSVQSPPILDAKRGTLDLDPLGD